MGVSEKIRESELRGVYATTLAGISEICLKFIITWLGIRWPGYEVLGYLGVGMLLYAFWMRIMIWRKDHGKESQ